MTKYEFVAILGTRVTQLNMGIKPMITDVGNMDPKEIAFQELKNGVIPLIVKRYIPNSEPEEIKIKDLEIPSYLLDMYES